jgi:hypothetical protein
MRTNSKCRFFFGLNNIYDFVLWYAKGQPSAVTEASSNMPLRESSRIFTPVKSNYEV